MPLLYSPRGNCPTSLRLTSTTSTARMGTHTRYYPARPRTKIRTLRLICSCAREFGEDINNSTAPWSWRRRVFAATLSCSEEENHTSTINHDGDHCEQQDGGCQNSTTRSAEDSRVGSKTDGVKRSGAAVVVLWALVHKASPVPRILARGYHRLKAKKCQDVLFLRPMMYVLRQGGAGGSDPVLSRRGLRLFRM